jgi:hypothetical protein
MFIMCPNGDDGPKELSAAVLTEEWSEYKVDDGTRLLVKTVVIKINWGGLEAGGSVPIQIAGNQVMSVFGSPGRPDNSLTQDVIKGRKKTTLGFETLSEPWNYYRLEGDRGFVKVRTTVASVDRVEGTFDAMGMPVYVCSFGVAGGKAVRHEVEAALQRVVEQAHRPTKGEAVS